MLPGISCACLLYSYTLWIDFVALSCSHVQSCVLNSKTLSTRREENWVKSIQIPIKGKQIQCVHLENRIEAKVESLAFC